jgi:hypothetical protein
MRQPPRWPMARCGRSGYKPQRRRDERRDRPPPRAGGGGERWERSRSISTCVVSRPWIPTTPRRTSAAWLASRARSRPPSGRRSSRTGCFGPIRTFRSCGSSPGGRPAPGSVVGSEPSRSAPRWPSWPTSVPATRRSARASSRSRSDRSGSTGERAAPCCTCSSGSRAGVPPVSRSAPTRPPSSRTRCSGTPTALSSASGLGTSGGSTTSWRCRGLGAGPRSCRSSGSPSPSSGSS